MLDCLIVGDSIAVGTKMFAPHCALQGRGGINTWQFNKMYNQSFYAETVIISLGSNDHKGVKTKAELLRMYFGFYRPVMCQQVVYRLRKFKPS